MICIAVAFREICFRRGIVLQFTLVPRSSDSLTSLNPPYPGGTVPRGWFCLNNAYLNSVYDGSLNVVYFNSPYMFLKKHVSTIKKKHIYIKSYGNISAWDTCNDSLGQFSDLRETVHDFTWFFKDVKYPPLILITKVNWCRY